MTGLAALFLHQPQLFDHHVLLHRLAHVVDGERRHGGRGEGFHLHPRLARELAQGADVDPILRRQRLYLYLHLGEGQGVAEGNEVGGLLSRHDAGDAGGGKDVPLVVLAAEDQGQGFRRHGDECLGTGLALGHLLVGHVHHVGLTALVEMGQVHVCPYRKIRRMIRVYPRDHRWDTKLHGRVRASS